MSDSESGQSDTTGGGKAPNKAAIWHATDGSDLRSMHDFILVRGPRSTRVLECSVGGAARAAKTLLEVAGFLPGSRGSGVEVIDTDVADRGFVLVRGFEIDPAEALTLELEIRAALAGDLGGFVPVLAAVATYHRAVHFAFEHVWAAAGKPPIVVRQPGLTGGPGRLPAPASLLKPSWGDPRYALSCTAAGETEPQDRTPDGAAEPR